MWKKGIVFSMAGGILLFAPIGCKSSAGGGTQLKGEVEEYVSEGWLDDDTFQVRALGAPNPNAKGFVRRRTQAKEAALLMAQKRVVELMVGSVIKGASGAESGEATGVVVTKELEGVIKGGQIVRERYDENDNCEIIYRIHRKGLRKMVEAMVAKKDFRQ